MIVMRRIVASFICAACCFMSHDLRADITNAFFEDWELGIQTQKWKTWGSPAPVVYTGEGVGGSIGFDGNGDGSYESGATTYQTFDVSQYPTIEFAAKGAGTAANFQHMAVGFSLTNADGYAGTAGQPEHVARISIDPNSAYAYICYDVGLERFTEVWSSSYNNVWMTYKMVVNTDGSVSFYRDSVLKYTSTNKLDLTSLTAKSIMVMGRSVSGHQIVDNIAVLGTLTVTSAPPMVFHSDRSGNYEVYGSDLDGTHQTNLTGHALYDYAPKTSPDRRKIAFVSNRGGQSEVWVMDVDGSSLVQVTTNGTHGGQNWLGSCAWLPDGRIVYSCDTALYRIDANGSNLTQLCTSPQGIHTVVASPTGNKIAFMSQGAWGYDLEIYLVDTNGANKTLLVPNDPGNLLLGAFSKDGTRLIYCYDPSGHEEGSGRSLDLNVYSIGIDGTGKTNLSISKPYGYNDQFPCLTPDGNGIFFNVRTNDGTLPSSLWRMNLADLSRVFVSSNAEMPDCGYNISGTLQPPNAPTGIAASDGTYTNNVAVSWSAASNAAKYAVWRGTSSSTTSAANISGDITVTNYNDIAVTPGTTYWYWVKAGNADGWSGFSTGDSGYAHANGAYYPFNGNANDESGNGHHGVVNGATLCTDRYAATNRAYHFDSTQYISLDSSRPIRGVCNTCTISVWFKPEIRDRGSIYIHQADYQGISMEWSSDDIDGFRRNAVNVGVWCTGMHMGILSSPVLTTGVWHHALMTANAGAMTLYIDGVAAMTTNIAGDLDWDVDFNAEGIGGKSMDAAYRFSGAIDDVRILTRALSPIEVAALYEAERPVTSPSSIAASDGTYSNKVAVSWNAVSNATKYAVWRNTSVSTASAANISGDLVATTWDDITAIPGQTYWYWVKAGNAAGWSAFSSADSGYVQVAGTGSNWVCVTAGAPWKSKWLFPHAVYQGKMWIAGDWFNGEGNTGVWSSTDGTNWTLVVAPAAYGKRSNMCMAEFMNKLWFCGGIDGNSAEHNDVWSSANGSNWTLETTAPWSARHNHGMAVYDGRLWVMGGYNGSFLRDVWCSSNGVDWTQTVATAPWTGGDAAGVVVHDGKLWHVGGSSNHGAYQNDVWYTTDGTNWTQATASAPWSAREYHAMAVANGRMWLMGGLAGGGSTYFGDVWSSADGTNWTRATETTPWGLRCGMASLAFANRLWIMGGYGALLTTNDVWCSPPPAPEPVSSTNLPSVPSSVSASDGTFTNKVVVSWTPSSNATRYAVWRGATSSTSGAANISGDIIGTSYNDTAVTPGVTYYYWVKAGNTYGWSGFSVGDSGYAAAPSARIAPPMVFISDRSGNWEIYGANLGGTEVTNLSNHAASDGQPRISPDATKIAFTSNRSGQFEVWVMDGNGGNQRQVTTTGTYGGHNSWGNCAWLADGRLIYTCGTILYRIEASGSNRVQLCTSPQGIHTAVASPTGNKIAFMSQGSWGYDIEVYLVDIDGSNRTLLVPNDPGVIDLGTFTKDGARLVYSYDPSGHEESSGRALDLNIYSIGIDGTGRTNLSTGKSANYNDCRPCLTPDGDNIVFETRPNDNSQPANLWRMSLQDLVRTFVASNGWQPDCGYSASNNCFLLPPNAPAGVAATDGSYPNKAVVSWAASSNATMYAVYRNTIAMPDAAVNISGDIIGTSFDDMSAVTGETYWYWVKAGSSYGWSTFSAGDSGYAGTGVSTPTVSPTALNFLTNLVSQFTYLGNAGTLPFSFTATVVTGGSWLSIDPGSGIVSNQSIALSCIASRAGLSNGTYFGTISIVTSEGTTLYVQAQMVVSDNAVIAEANGPYTVNQGSPAMLTAAGSQGNRLLYRWEVGLDFISGYSSNYLGFTFTNTFVPETIDVILTVRDTNSPPHTASDSTTLTILNVPPTVDLAGPYAGNMVTDIVLTASVTDPGISDTFLYRWDFNGDGTPDTGWIANGTTSHLYTVAGSYVAACEVQDNYGGVGADSAVILIAQPNLPPVATAVVHGTTISVTNLPGMGLTVSMSGTGSLDPDHAPFTNLFFDWREDVANPQKPVTFATNRHDAILTTMPLRQPGEYKFHLVVCDGEYNSQPATVTVRVPGWRGEVICEGFAAKVPLWGVEATVTNAYTHEMHAGRSDTNGLFVADSGRGYQIALLSRNSHTKMVSVNIDADGEFTENIYFPPRYFIYAGNIVTGTPGHYVGLDNAHVGVLIGNGLTTPTDLGGSFGFGSVPETWPLDGDQYTIRFQKTGVRSRLVVMPVTMNRNSELVLMERATGTVEVRGMVVTEGLPQPVRGVVVNFGLWSAVSGSNGAFGPITMPEGDYAAVMTRQGYEKTIIMPLVLTPGSTNLTLTIQGGRVSAYGEIVNGAGAVITNAMITTLAQGGGGRKSGATTGEYAATGAGYYDMLAAKGEECVYVVSAPGYDVQQVVLDMGTHTKQNVVLVPEPAIAGAMALCVCAFVRWRLIVPASRRDRYVGRRYGYGVHR